MPTGIYLKMFGLALCHQISFDTNYLDNWVKHILFKKMFYLDLLRIIVCQTLQMIWKKMKYNMYSYIKHWTPVLVQRLQFEQYRIYVLSKYLERCITYSNKTVLENIIPLFQIIYSVSLLISTIFQGYSLKILWPTYTILRMHSYMYINDVKSQFISM